VPTEKSRIVVTYFNNITEYVTPRKALYFLQDSTTIRVLSHNHRPTGAELLEKLLVA